MSNARLLKIRGSIPAQQLAVDSAGISVVIFWGHPGHLVGPEPILISRGPQLGGFG